jgi:hypothetical protein
MRTTARSATAALLSVPLVLSLSAPALAAPPVKYSASGSFAQAGGFLLGAVEGVEGNVHMVMVGAQQSEDGIFGGGYIDSYLCPEGVTNPYPDDPDAPEGEWLCEPAGSFELWSENVTFTTDKKVTSASINGMFDLVWWECGEFEEECSRIVMGSLWADLDLTATGKAATYRYKESYRDPETGFSYKGMSTEKSSPAEVTGTVGGAELTDAMGYLGTFRFRSMEKM